MLKPANYDQVTPKDVGEFIRVPGSAVYHCIITGAEDSQSKESGANMVVLTLDIASGEYANAFKDSQYPPKYYQVVEGNSIEFFKGMITAIEQSNPGYTWDWNTPGLVNKYCAVAFREKEYRTNDGTIKTIAEPAWIRSLQALREGKIPIPKPKRLAPDSYQSIAQPVQPILAEEELPWV